MMRIVTTIEELYSEVPTAVAIGKFDGVHLGHRRLLASVVRASAGGLLPCAFTFEPSPERFFGGSAQRILSTRDEKRQLLEAAGIGLLIEYPLNCESAAIAPEVFVREFLHRRLKAGRIVAGADLSFGAEGRGDFSLLNAMRPECGYETEEIEKLMIDGSPVSSSRIRRLVAKGAMEDAALCLGNAYSLEGEVVHGAGRGKGFGFPTLNLIPAEEKLLPPFGVYLCNAYLFGKKWEGLCNIGMKPTVSSEQRIGAETFLFGLDRDAYGEKLRLELLHYTRPERKFEDISGLKKQLDADIQNAKELFGYMSERI